MTQKATVINNPADLVVQAIFLRGHITLMNKGMKHSRLNKGDIIAKINNTIGTSFTNRQGVKAEAAVRAFIAKYVPQQPAPVAPLPEARA